ncbi:MAG TPA: hypothetical protein VJQ84_05725 [Solirubrobacterales bacterium]|nr:hypothetical protein [Solirubrobacterales bacterium]
MVPEARAAGDGLPLTAPADGVVTAWKINSAHPLPVPEWPAAFRSTDKAGTFQVVGEGTEILVSQGLNVFPTRVPVRAGDRFGLIATGENSPLYCFTGNTGDVTWSFRGGVGPGSIHTFAAGTEVLVPLVAVIEPDRDGDGYGDETQDGCPQSAAYQGPCPTISLDSFPIVLKRSVLVLVSASESSSVQVFGQVGWRPRHKGGALASKTPKKPGDHVSTGVVVGLSGGTTLVKPGETVPYNVKLPKSVLRHLSQLTPKQVVKATLTARTTDLAGRTVDHTITIRLHGRGPLHPAGAP